MTNSRNSYFDFIKGVAILMVIGIHTSIGLGFGSFSEYLGTTVRQVLNCAVPVFLACSGFFLAKKSLSTSNEITGFYKKQILRVYLPCLIWSVPWLLLHLINGRPLATGIVMFLFCGFTIYYFVLLIIQLYLLLPVIQKITCKLGGGNCCAPTKPHVGCTTKLY